VVTRSYTLVPMESIPRERVFLWSDNKNLYFVFYKNESNKQNGI